MSEEKPKRELSEKQLLWISFYFGKAKGNATLAARLAGYANPEMSGHENRKKLKDSEEYIAYKQNLLMSAEEVQARLSDIARGDFDNVLKDGELNIQKARRLKKTHLIKSIKIKKYTQKNRAGEPESTVEFQEVALHDPLTALNILAKMHGLTSTVIEIDEDDESLDQVQIIVHSRRQNPPPEVKPVVDSDVETPS